MAIQRITPFLWYDNQAEEAATLYTSIFPNSRVVKALRCGPAGPGPVGSVLTVDFELDGQKFAAINGGPQHKFNEAVSFLVNCQTQAEVDQYWDKLIADGGAPIQCGWLKDKFGLRWQIVPTMLLKLIGDPDPQKSSRVMQAMYKMVKLDIAALQAAHDGG